MKKFLAISAVGLVLAGFGCAKENTPAAEVVTGVDGTIVPPKETVVGAWYLTLDMPEGWVMVPPYDENIDANPAAAEVTSDMADVIVQSTSKAIALTGTSALHEGEYVADNYTSIHVFRMEKRTRIPEDAKDLGNGFFSVQKDVNTIYYLAGEGATYKFVVYQKGNEASLAEQVTTSAKEVVDISAQVK